MAGHRRSKNGVASLAYVPAIHVLMRGKDVDARHTAGHDAEIYFAAVVLAASAFSICGLNSRSRLSGVSGPTSL